DRHTARIYVVAMVLGGDAHHPGLEILHRMVAAPVAELQPSRLGADGTCQQLVAETDPEERDSRPENALHGLHRRLCLCRIARSWRGHHAIRCQRQNLGYRRRYRNDRNTSTTPLQRRDDALLQTTVEHDDVRARA